MLKLLLVFFVVAFFSGCTKEVDEKHFEKKSGNIMIDHIGREVFIPERVERIIALSRSHMEDLFELGITPIAKVEEYNYRPEGVALPSISSQNNPNIEKIMSLRPDFILANSRHHLAMREQLELAGAPVFFVDPNYVEVDALTDKVVLFGKMFNKTNEAEAYISQLDAVAKEMRLRILEGGLKNALIVQGGVDTVMAAQSTGLYGAILSRLGLRNIVPGDLLGSNNSTFVPYDLEQVIKADPDIIMVRSAGAGRDNVATLYDYYKKNPQWSSLRAIREGRLVILPRTVNPGSVSNIEVIRISAEAILKVMSKESEI